MNRISPFFQLYRKRRFRTCRHRKTGLDFTAY